MGWDGKLDATEKRASKALSAMEKAGLYDSNDPKDVAKRNAGAKKLVADSKSGNDWAKKLLKDKGKNEVRSAALERAKRRAREAADLGSKENWNVNKQQQDFLNEMNKKNSGK